MTLIEGRLGIISRIKHNASRGVVMRERLPPCESRKSKHPSQVLLFLSLVWIKISKTSHMVIIIVVVFIGVLS